MDVDVGLVGVVDCGVKRFGEGENEVMEWGGGDLKGLMEGRKKGEEVEEVG